MTVSIFPSLALKTGSLFPYHRHCDRIGENMKEGDILEYIQIVKRTYGLESQNRMIAASIGMKKPWINGMEYYIDQFYVKTDWQGKGTGSLFLKLIESEIRTEKMNAIILNTEKGFPAENFYLKNGFRSNEELIILSSFIYCDQGKKK